MKRYLAERAVRYQLKDIHADAGARAEFLRAGWKLPPVLVIDGVPVEGFRPERIEELLDRHTGTP